MNLQNKHFSNQLYTRYLPRSVLLSNLEWHGWILAKWYCHRNNGKYNALWESFTIFFSGQGRQYYVIQQVSKHSPEIRGLCSMTVFFHFCNFTYFYLINALVYVNLCNTFTVTCKQKNIKMCWRELNWWIWHIPSKQIIVWSVLGIWLCCCTLTHFL